MWESVFSFLHVLAQSTATLIIVLDPLGLLPIVVGITSRMSAGNRRVMLNKATLIAFGLLILFTLTGKSLLRLFNITLDDLQVSGGILLLVIALSIVLKGHSSTTPESDSSVGIVPLISPLLVGPGAITATIILVGSVGILITSASVILSLLITWAVLRSTPIIYRVLGAGGSDVAARIMGILLAAIAVVYMRNGLFGILAARGLCK